MEQQQTLPDIIGRITGAMERNLIGPGERAELRRLDVAHPHSPAFWKVMSIWVESSQTPESETRWAIVLSGFARMGLQLNKRGVRLGQALYNAGYSESRLLKLLRAKGPTFADTVRRLCSFLAAKAEPVDWVDLARFILTADEQKADEVRRHIARDYYATS